MTSTDQGVGTRAIDRIGWPLWFLAAAGIVVLMGIAMYAMGRAPYYTGGAVKLWYGVFGGKEQSKHFADWYTITHLLHGPAFFFLLWLVFKKGLNWALPAGLLFVLAIAIEAGWEIFENTDLIINRFRTRTIDSGYTGDTLLNSLGDILAMAIGYLVTMRFPIWATIGLFIAVELALLAGLRDNLTLQFIMLIYPIEAIKTWQESAQIGTGGDLLYAVRLAAAPPVWLALMAGRFGCVSARNDGGGNAGAASDDHGQPGRP